MHNVKKRVVLALETGIGGGSLSLVEDGMPLASATGTENASRSEDLLLILEDFLAKNSILKHQIGAIAVSDGPGSLTGIRIGLALAKGLSDALSVPYIKLSMLAAMALSSKKEGAIVSAISYKDQTVYFKEFRVEQGRLADSASETEKIGLDDFLLRLQAFHEKGAFVVLNKELNREASKIANRTFKVDKGGIYCAGNDYAKILGQIGELLTRPIMKTPNIQK
ncbi:MAG TPA: tRNA (adenosine(37)-N6)-threonylcarbamoyltransferase complex dimerization subunit type 1 TsaB [Pyrinomonadaceae bacterium]|jgi:tRNA threonylcarbamoyladenosine biosynthesis protein TsaB